uniref:TonB-dependent receptor n=1 Tax=Pseudomaricurvus sp. TaxID=2004510 RepID=UPI003F6BBB27
MTGFQHAWQAARRLATPACLLALTIHHATVHADNTTKADPAKASPMETMVVTSTKEAKSKSDLAESLDSLDASELELIGPAHPAEALNRIAGVHINNLGGEGHMTAIRQPITTSGVYLFLEDGLPTRPTGFFNHNGLYEVNVSQGSRLEVTKGPGSALYGSDAIGGVINSVTKPSPDQPEADINVELGAYGWKRALLSGGTDVGEDSGVRVDLNATDNEGYRDDSEYTRYSSTLRFDSQLSQHWDMKAIASYTDVDQSGVSGLEEDDYKNNPEKNEFTGDIGYRQVQSLRISSEFNYTPNADQLLTLTPYYRDNSMRMMPSWMVTYDPNVRDYEFQSYGMLVKFRQSLFDGTGEIIVGLDTDYTPSTYTEEVISVTRNGDFYTDYQTTGQLNYDFDAEQTSLSPYVHTDWHLTDELILSAGLRYDHFSIDYKDSGKATSSSHIRPESQSLSFEQFSPKAGLVYQYSENHNAYVNYRHSFRAPTIGTLFRPGSSMDSTDLQPVTSESYEMGFRGQFNERLGYELALYHMSVEDDIVSYIEGNDRISTNAGETSHQGIELTLTGSITEEVSFNIAWSWAEHQYEDYSYVYGYFNPSLGRYVTETRNYDGYDMGKAPKTMGNVTLAYRPDFIPNTRFELEWDHQGEYYTDETNTSTYQGHDLLNLRANYDI